jgi:hypothetical protein
VDGLTNQGETIMTTWAIKNRFTGRTILTITAWTFKEVMAEIDRKYYMIVSKATHVIVIL